MKCPICGKPVERENNPARPFCSDRCRLIDFGKWANEEYAVPADETAPSTEEFIQPANSEEQTPH